MGTRAGCVRASHRGAARGWQERWVPQEKAGGRVPPGCGLPAKSASGIAARLGSPAAEPATRTRAGAGGARTARAGNSAPLWAHQRDAQGAQGKSEGSNNRRRF